MFSLLADVVVVGGGGWGISQILIAILIIGAVIAIVFIGLRQCGITIPPAVVQILWIVAIVALCIIAIKFLLSL